MDAAFEDALSNITKGVTDASKIVLSLFDGGVQIYGGVAERVNAIKKINSEIAKPSPAIASTETPKTLTAIENFIKSESGLLTVGALAVLVLGLIFSRGD